MELRNIIVAILLCGTGAVSAQQTFVQRVTARMGGDGTVVLHQDAALEALVNGTAVSKSKSKPQPTKADSSPASAHDHGEEQAVVETSEVDLGDGRKIYRNSMKMQGYRVQVYSGGNSRTAKQAAERAARQVKSYFPDQPVYTHFYSPRWICRVGDFRTMEEANEVLRQMKETGGFGQAVIVKSVVQIAL